MEQVILFRGNIRKYKGVWIGVLILSIMVSTCISSVVSFWQNSNNYVNQEINRLGFGDLTIWVSGILDTMALSEEILENSAVENLEIQPVIFSDYRIGSSDSDTEGQLIAYEPNRYNYKIFSDDLKTYIEEPIRINSDEVYISPALKSNFNINIGDRITFYIERQGGGKTLTVKGYYEDPFMGSSMIGMKGFLIGGDNYEEIIARIDHSGIDRLARAGNMLHVFSKSEENLSSTDLNRVLNEETSLSNNIEFVHSHTSILGFMMLLQNIFAGFLVAFSIVLVIVCLIVLGHSIGSAIEEDYGNIGIFKAIGMTGPSLRWSLIYFYGLAIGIGLIAGVLLGISIIPIFSAMTLTATGLLIPSNLAVGLCGLSLITIYLLFMGFIIVKTRKIIKVTPLSAIRKDMKNPLSSKRSNFPIHKSNLPFWIALRQVTSGKKRYIGICVITVLLVFVMSLVGRMSQWLGPKGEGMMAAFNPADHHIGVQTLGDVENGDIELLINSQTKITDTYLLAMPSLSIDGVDYTANVISEPERFQILKGKTSLNPDEIVLTELLGENLGVSIGDTINIGYKGKSESYRISGFYQCANDMGDNFGMSREGFLRIGEDSPEIWCKHYFISEPSKKNIIIQELEDTFGRNLHLHENTWSGLDSIIKSMGLLNTVLYGMVIMFVFISVALTVGKILMSEEKSLGIYKCIGFQSKSLRLSFAFRFGIVSLFGAVLGVISSRLFGDAFISLILKTVGVSNFSSDITGGQIILLIGFTALLNFFSAYLITGKIKKVEMTSLL